MPGVSDSQSHVLMCDYKPILLSNLRTSYIPKTPGGGGRVLLKPPSTLPPGTINVCWPCLLNADICLRMGLVGFFMRPFYCRLVGDTSDPTSMCSEYVKWESFI